ncbi:MAG: hypothetical protein AVDCRST_MAG79-1644, partial [uncultured Thermoleophilia bacterium]
GRSAGDGRRGAALPDPRDPRGGGGGVVRAAHAARSHRRAPQRDPGPHRRAGRRDHAALRGRLEGIAARPAHRRAEPQGPAADRRGARPARSRRPRRVRGGRPRRAAGSRRALGRRARGVRAHPLPARARRLRPAPAAAPGDRGPARGACRPPAPAVRRERAGGRRAGRPV